MSMNLILAVFAGCLSSLGSVFSKLPVLFQAENEQLDTSFIILTACFGSMIICNTAGLFLFTKSLQEVDSSIIVTVTSTACNYIASGIFGTILFGEIISIQWIIGMVFTIIGIYLITTDSTENAKVNVS